MAGDACHLRYIMYNRNISSIFLNIFQTGRTPLHLASEAGHIEAVMRLIDMSCNANARDKVV